MRIGIAIGPQKVGWRELRDVALQAEEAGLDSVWIFDHLLPLTDDAEDPVFECFAVLAALAEATRRVELGTFVVNNTLRAPALLAKIAGTIDQISDGRVILGLGAGYLESENATYGIAMGPRRERAAQLDEACEILTGLFGEQRRFTFAGEHYQVTDAPFQPPPVRPSGIPLMIGGVGERYTLRTVAQYADQWNMSTGSSGYTPQEFAQKVAVLEQRCAEVDRDPATIEKNASLIVIVDADHATALARRNQLAAQLGWSEEVGARQIVAGDPAAVTETLQAFADAGADHFVATLVNGANYDAVPLLAEAVAPHLRTTLRPDRSMTPTTPAPSSSRAGATPGSGR